MLFLFAIATLGGILGFLAFVLECLAPDWSGEVAELEARVTELEDLQREGFFDEQQAK